MQDIAVIRKLIDANVQASGCEFQQFTVRALEGFDYYGNQDKIKQCGAAAIDEVNAYLKIKGANPLHSADNRISMNRHKIVVDQKIGYLFSKPPQFDLPEDDAAAGDKALLKQVNDTVGTDWPKVIKQLGIDASNTGRAWMAYWSGDDGFHFWYVNPLTVTPIYDRSTVRKRLQYLIRSYSYIDATGNPCTRYEVWDENEVAYLIRPQAGTAPQIDFEVLPGGAWNIQKHDYGRIPFIEFDNDAHADGDLHMYRDIIDAFDKLFSGFANDIDDLQEIIWCITNYRGATSETTFDKDGNEINKTVDLLQELKAKKWVSVDDKGGLEAIHGEIPYEARGKMYELLDAEFWKAAMAVNPAPDTAGNQSGVYIDHLYGLLELKAGLMETEFRSAINEFLAAILHYLKADESKQFVQTWKRTKPQNDVEVSQIIAQTPSTVVSDETKTKKHPLVDDWEAERARIKKEQEQKQQDMLDQYPPGHEQEPGGPQQPNANDGGAA